MDNPDISELYPELDTSTYREVYERQSEADNQKSGVKRNSRVRRLIGTGLLAGALTALSIFSPSCNSHPPATPTPIVTPTPTQPTQTVDLQQQYRSQIEQYLKQDVPALAQDAKSFNYALDRLTEWGTLPYGSPIDYQSIRQPLIKWIDANITWQNKGERLYQMNEIDFLTDKLFDNFISDAGKPLDNETYFENNVNYLVAKHDALWKEMHDTEEIKPYIAEADRWINSNLEINPKTLEIAKVYKKALLEKGTEADKIALGVYGYSLLKGLNEFKYSNEERRVELTALYLFSIGGEAQRSNMMFVAGGHGEPSFKISPQLESEYKNNPQIYGTKLDNGYLTVPYSREGAEAILAGQLSRGLQPLMSVERNARPFRTDGWIKLWQK
ncbi:MAG: hypothetical protein V1731_00410 [Candidatus Aenigmatarchaeota archaeon]